MIPARRRYEYASGYLALGMVKDAASELRALSGSDAETVEALQLWIALRHETKEWEPLVSAAKKLARLYPDMEQGWVSWAYALRELDRVAEAQSVLREAEPRHGDSCAVLHYNLGCYACLLGDREEARRRLERAFSMDPEFKDSAPEDPDLASMREELE